MYQFFSHLTLCDSDEHTVSPNAQLVFKCFQPGASVFSVNLAQDRYREIIFECDAKTTVLVNVVGSTANITNVCAVQGSLFGNAKEKTRFAGWVEVGWWNYGQSHSIQFYRGAECFPKRHTVPGHE